MIFLMHLKTHKKEKKMGRRKGSKNKPKVDGAVKTTKAKASPAKKTVKTLGTPEAPVAKRVVEETAKTVATSARKTKDGGVVIAPTRDSDGKAPRYDVVIRGGKAVKVESTDEPELD